MMIGDTRRDARRLCLAQPEPLAATRLPGERAYADESRSGGDADARRRMF